MKKLLTFLLSVLLLVSGAFALVACGREKVMVYFPDGTPGLALAQAITEGVSETNVTFNFEPVPATEIAGVVANGEADLAIMPTTAAATLYGKKNVKIQLMSTNVFGNLYVVGYGENRAEDLHGLVGKVVYYTTGTTVDMFRYIIDQTEGLEYAEMGNTSDVDPEKINLQQATEGSEIIAFMADAKKNNKECYGVLGEPQVTACKAKVEGSDFIVDFQEEWKKLTGEEGYPQASLVVKSEFAENHADVAEAFANSLAGNAAWLENADNIARFKQALKDGDYTSSLITAPITAETVANCHLGFQKSSDIKQSVKDYVEILNKQDLDDGFFYTYSA